jgi:hypothetical protein
MLGRFKVDASEHPFEEISYPNSYNYLGFTTRD